MNKLDTRLRILYSWMLKERMTVYLANGWVHTRYYDGNSWHNSMLSGNEAYISGIFSEYAVDRR
jgi:hypothetical protein